MKEPFLRKREQNIGPLKVLLLCSDSPQHKYLRYLISREFPEFCCIVETDAGQVRYLRKKRKYYDLLYKQYHGWRRKRSGDSTKRREFFEALYPSDANIPPPDLEVDTLNQRKVWDLVAEWKPELTICTGTKFIGKKLIGLSGLMLNLHTGYLPDYRGNQCIFFAMYNGEMDKIAGTIHQLTAELDGGAMLDQLFPEINSGDSEEVLYARCSQLMIERVVELAEAYENGTALTFIPQENTGTTYRHRDRSPWKEWQLKRRLKKRNG